MQRPEQHSWVNLVELKSEIIRKLGPERSKQYFDYLNKFLSLKLSKGEFDKLCLSTVGRDGIPLHNQLIRSVLRNACTGKGPVGNKKSLDGVYHQNGSLPAVTHGSLNSLALPNGDVLAPLPRKARTAVRERRDRKNAIGPNEKTNFSSSSSSIPHADDFTTSFENGDLSTPDRGPVHHHHLELIQQGELSSRKDGKGASSRNSLHAPLGIPYCPVSIGGARKTPFSSKWAGVSDTNTLSDTITLKARMQPVAASHGLQGVSMDCANALNNGLDMYLKGLIQSCCVLNGAGSGSGSGNGPNKNNPAHFRPLNGVRPGHHYQTQVHESKRPISLLDFRVAMELNPGQLGEDWPILLEKICTHAFEE